MFQAHCIWHRCWWIGRKISNIWEHFWRDLPSILWCMTFFFFTILFIWFHSFFVKIVIQEFENEYLPPINNHMAKALCNMHEGIGWPGLLGSLDCSHWNWAKCPKSLQGEHKKGSKDMPTVVYECACDYQLHIWHCHFALPGACNDLNVRSSINWCPLSPKRSAAAVTAFNLCNSYNMYWMYRHLLFNSRMARRLQIFS